MMKKLIAKTQEGTEFLHSRNNTFFASANAQRIADILNKNNYDLSQNQKWFVYDYDYSQEIYTTQRIFINSKGQIKAAYV